MFRETELPDDDDGDDDDDDDDDDDTELPDEGSERSGRKIQRKRQTFNRFFTDSASLRKSNWFPWTLCEVGWFTPTTVRQHVLENLIGPPSCNKSEPEV